MNEHAVRKAMAGVRACGQAMVESASYIQAELSNVRMSDTLRSQTEQICDALAGTGLDILSELDELDELIGPEAPISKVHSRFHRLLRWMRQDVDRMQRLVEDLESDRNRDVKNAAAFALVAESAVNVFEAFNRLRVEVEKLPAT